MFYGYDLSKRDEMLWRKVIRPVIGDQDVADGIETDLNAYGNYGCMEVSYSLGRN